MRSCCLFWLSATSPLSSLRCPSSLLSSCPFSCPSTSSSTMWWTNSLCTLANEDLGTLAEYDPLTGYEPNDFHISEATEPYIQESSVENGSPNDLEYNDVTPSARRSLHHCTPRSEKMMRAVDEPITLKTKVCCPVSRRPSVSDRTGRPVVWNRLTHKFRNVREIQRATAQKVSRSAFFWSDKESRFSLIFKAEIRKHEFQADLWQKKYSKVEWNDRVSKEKKLVVLIKETNDFDEINHFFMNNFWHKIGIFVKLMMKSLSEMEELKRFQGLTFDTIARRKIGRRSRCYPWTHRQDSGITE